MPRVSNNITGFCDLEESGEWSSAETHFIRARRRCLQPFVDRLREDIPERIVVDLTDPVLRSLRLDTVLFSIFVDRLIQDQVNPVIGTRGIHLVRLRLLIYLKCAATPTGIFPLRFRMYSATPSFLSCVAGNWARLYSPPKTPRLFHLRSYLRWNSFCATDSLHIFGYSTSRRISASDRQKSFNRDSVASNPMAASQFLRAVVWWITGTMLAQRNPIR